MHPGWRQLPDGYEGPLVAAGLRRADRPHATALAVQALIDTGATHTIVDAGLVQQLALPVLDARRMRIAGTSPDSRAELPVHEVLLSFPDHPFPERRVRVGAMPLPGAFQVLVGMDLLLDTRLSLEWTTSGRWLRWEPLSR